MCLKKSFSVLWLARERERNISNSCTIFCHYYLFVVLLLSDFLYTYYYMCHMSLYYCVLFFLNPEQLLHCSSSSFSDPSKRSHMHWLTYLEAISKKGGSRSTVFKRHTVDINRGFFKVGLLAGFLFSGVVAECDVSWNLVPRLVYFFYVFGYAFQKFSLRFVLDIFKTFDYSDAKLTQTKKRAFNRL